MVYVADTQNNRVVRLFDPSSWVSGTNDFTDPTVGPTSVAVGPGQLLGTSLTLDASMGLVVGDTTKIGAGGSLVLAGGTLSTNTLAVCPGGFLQIGNGGSIGSLSGAIVNNGAVTIVSSEAPEVVSSAISNTGSLLVEGNGLVTLMGAVVNNGSLNINAKSVCANISGSGTLTVGTIGSPTTLQLAAGSGPDDQSMLTVNIGSTLDITNNAIAINYGCPANDPVKAILRYLLSGYIGGSWTGTEIISSTAAAGYAAGTGPALSIGYADGNTDADTVAGPNQVLVKFTLAGDALLNGTVDFNDLDVVGRHLNTTGNDWADGNFTYDPKGAVNFNDLDIIGQNLNMTLNGSGDLLGGTTIPLGAAANIQNTIVIPEPSVLAVGAAGAAAMLLCRRRRCYS
jgi:fibronectin-binding autotransporter adhesin